MPLPDLLGFLLIEEIEGSEKFISRFFHLNQTTGQLEYFTNDPSKSTDSQLIGTFSLRYLSLVDEATRLRPSLAHGFYVNLCGQKTFLVAADDEERSKWIKAIADSYKIAEQVRRQSLGGAQSLASSVVISTDISCKKTGYCIKQGLKRKNWKRRYFVLDSYGLAYYISHEDTTPIKLINLADICQARISVGIHVHKHNVFEVVTPQRVFYIQAESAYERELWINAINRQANARKQSKVKPATEPSAAQACVALR